MLRDGGKTVCFCCIIYHNFAVPIYNVKFGSRLAADFLNDLGTFLELLAPLFPFFLLLVCAASVSKVSR